MAEGINKFIDQTQEVSLALSVSEKKGIAISYYGKAKPGTELAQACTATIHTKLLKIGAAVLRNTRRVRVLLASAHPMKQVFLAAACALGP